MPRTRDKATLLLPQAGRKRKYFSEGARARARAEIKSYFTARVVRVVSK